MILEIITFALGLSAGVAGSIFYKKDDLSTKLKAELETVKSDFASLESKVESLFKKDETKVSDFTNELSKFDETKTEDTTPSEPVKTEEVSTPTASA